MLTTRMGGGGHSAYQLVSARLGKDCTASNGQHVLSVFCPDMMIHAYYWQMAR